MNTPLFNLRHNCAPVALYTYETAHSQDNILKFDNSPLSFDTFKDLVTRYFGENHMDNKITIECELDLDTTNPMASAKQPVYITYWDGVIYLGLSVRFDKDFTKPGNEYRKVIALTKR